MTPGFWLQTNDEAEMETQLTRFANAGFSYANVLCFNHGALYDSVYLQPSPYYRFDVLDAACRIASSLNIQIGAWVCFGHIAPYCTVAPAEWDLSNVCNSRPWSNFALEEVRDLLQMVVAEILRYPIDVFHADYLRTPDLQTYPEVGDIVQTEHVTDLVARIHALTTWAGLDFTAFTKDRCDPSRWRQDWHGWLGAGLVHCIPGIYNSGQPLSALADDIDTWPVQHQEDITPGLSAMDHSQPGEPLKPVQRLRDEIDLVLARGYDRICLFDQRTSDDMLEMIARYTMDVIDHLLAAEEKLRAAGLEAEANQVADLITSLQVRDDELDELSRVIEDD